MEPIIFAEIYNNFLQQWTNRLKFKANAFWPSESKARPELAFAGIDDHTCLSYDLATFSLVCIQAEFNLVLIVTICKVWFVPNSCPVKPVQRHCVHHS